LKPELLEDVIHPAALESCAQIVEDINECKEQLRKQLDRLRELRIKKVEEPG
jgi:elongator complex protein 1